MPKWTSPLFTDIRNALGTSVVFSNWKGRPYMRAWVKPSNPQSNAQQAGRDIMRKLVARYQQVVIVSNTAPENAAAWNAEALQYAISGFNLFTKWGRKSNIAVPASASGTGSATVEVTYTLGLPASKAALYYEKGGTFTDAQKTLTAGSDQTVEVTVNENGSYTFWIADKEAVTTGDSGAQDYQAITCWGMPTGAPLDTAAAATCAVTVS